MSCGRAVFGEWVVSEEEGEDGALTRMGASRARRVIAFSPFGILLLKLPSSTPTSSASLFSLPSSLPLRS